MTKKIIFTPRAELDAAANLLGLIDICRYHLKPFGAAWFFDDDVWDVTEACLRRGVGNQRIRFHFTNLETTNTSEPVLMAEPFLGFAKAYVCYTYYLRPTKVISHLILALRCSEAALRESGLEASPSRINTDVMNRAAQLAQEHYSPSVAHQLGRHLTALSKFVSENFLTVVPFQWVNPIPKPAPFFRIGKEFDELRYSKLPSEAALEALPKIFLMAQDPADIIVSSIAAILCAAPSRICEIFDLPVNCIVNLTYGPDKKEVMGLRWWPAKGGEPSVKTIYPDFADVVREAIEKIKLVTADARKVSKWYEEHPRQLYLPEGTSALREKEWLTMEELAAILGSKNAKNAKHWCAYTAKIPISDSNEIRFFELQSKILKMLPTSFPFFSRHTKLKYSEALFPILKNQLHPARNSMLCMIEAMSMNTVNYGLGSRVKHGSNSIFSRFDFTEPDGSPIKVSTHQFRHLLNTIAQRGGMSQVFIAKWSGRVSVHQNAAYDHTTHDEMIQIYQTATGSSENLPELMNSMPFNAPISRDEFDRLRVPTIHTSDIGFCLHDFVMSPCSRFRKCITCSDFVCVKGDAQKAARLQKYLEDARNFLCMVEEALAEEYAGSDFWLEYYQEIVGRYEQICSFLDDSHVPNGAAIRLSASRSIETLSGSHQQISNKMQISHRME